MRLRLTEDEPVLADLIIEFPRDEGHDVALVSDPERAGELVRTKRSLACIELDAWAENPFSLSPVWKGKQSARLRLRKQLPPSRGNRRSRSRARECSGSPRRRNPLSPPDCPLLSPQPANQP